MNSDALAVLKGLAGLSGRPTTRAVAVEANLDPPAVEDILAALAMVGLVEPSGPGRWRGHHRLRRGDACLVLRHLAEILDGSHPALVEGQPPPPEEPPSPPSAVHAPDTPKQLTAAARELGVHPDTLDVWAKQGLVPFTWTVGGRRRFLVSEIQAHLQERSAA